MLLSISDTRLFTLSRRTSQTVLLSIADQLCGPKPQRINLLVWALSFMLAATQEIDVSFFLRVLRCFSSGFLSHYVFIRVRKVFCVDFHSGNLRAARIFVLTAALSIAYHVFRRLSVPRHHPMLLQLNLIMMARSPFGFADFQPLVCFGLDMTTYQHMSH